MRLPVSSAKRRNVPKPSDGAVDREFRLMKAIEKLEVDVMEFSRDVEGRLDTRIRTLTKLISDADDRIERLRAAGGKPNGSSDDVPELHREVYRLADDGLDNVEIARRVSSTPGEVELIIALRETRGK